MDIKKGNLSINSDNIFPIIKKWLYSDHDIFLRELVSNGCDAITKLKKLALIGEFDEPKDEKYRLDITCSSKAKTLTVTDNGIGMTADEIEKYINQIAFSGAKDFLEMYKDKSNDDQIIGHFGLGFYSAFMVADKVTIDSLSYQEGAQAVHWESDGGTTFTMKDSDKTTRGTVITLYLNDESAEFANEYRVKEVLGKYCSFMPTPIYLLNSDSADETQTIEKDELLDTDTIVETIVEDAKEADAKDDAKETKEKYKIKKRPTMVNDTNPLWTRHPNECSDEDYKSFYTKVFMDYKEPLFWIHLNMDYPFNLKGILYFPKINTEYDSIEGTIKLYNNQVFIAENIKEVTPEFLMLLKGVIDCPDLPLNVSRSALQNNGFVQKIRDYIVKKVAEKITGLCKTDREKYEKYWDDISPFIKFGCLKDEKFAEKVNDYILFKNLEHKYLTLKDCIEANKEKYPDKIFYVNDESEQSQYIEMFKSQGIDAVILPHSIDAPFISHLEMKNENLHFLRIDADINEVFKEKDDTLSDADKDTYEALVFAMKKELGMQMLDVNIESLKDESKASILTVNEDSRRMQQMMRQYGMSDMSSFGDMGESLTLNSKNPLVKYLLEHVVVEKKEVKKDATDSTSDTSTSDEKTATTSDGSDDKTATTSDESDAKGGETKIEGTLSDETSQRIAQQLYDLAKISHGSLSPQRLGAFIERSNEIMAVLMK